MLNATAEAWIASIKENILFPGEMVGPLKLKHDVFEGSSRIENGKFLLNADLNGFGVNMDQVKLSRFGTCLEV